MNESSSSGGQTMIIRRIIAFLGILLIIASQFLIYSIPVVENQPPLSVILLAGGGLILFLLSPYIPVKSSIQEKLERIHIPRPAFWIITALILAIISAISLLLFIKSNKTTFIPVLTTWFTAGAFYIFAFRDAELTSGRARQWMSVHRVELMILAGTTLLAALLRFSDLGEYPRVIDGDEGLMGLFAQSTVSGVYANPFALWENFGALYLQAINFIFRIFGISAFSLRFLPALSGTLAIPAIYLFARQVGGKRIAIIASFMLAISHTHIHFSRIASVGYIHSTWLVPLELFLLLRGLEKKKNWLAAAGGVLLAIHFSVYLTSQIIAGLVLAFVIITFLLMRKWFLQVSRQMAAFFGGLLIMILPELFFILKNPNEFFNRLSQDGTFQSGWLQQTMAATGQSAFEVLAGRVAHAFLSLFYYPARDFYGSNIPMLTLFTTVFFLVGLVLALRRLRSPGVLLLNGYFWAPVLAIGIFSVPPSADSYRMLITLPPALLMAAMGIDTTLDLLGVGWNRTRLTYGFIIGTLLLSQAAFNLWAYYGDFVGQCRYEGNLTGRFASYLGKFVKSVDEGSNVYLLSDGTYFYGSHASTDFLSGQRKITNISEPVDTWQSVMNDTIIASPNRIPELQTWIQAHPGGQTHYIRDCSNLILLAYKVP